jgi:hypothetical protein
VPVPRTLLCSFTAYTPWMSYIFQVILKCFFLFRWVLPCYIPPCIKKFALLSWGSSPSDCLGILIYCDYVWWYGTSPFCPGLLRQARCTCSSICCYSLLPKDSYLCTVVCMFVCIQAHNTYPFLVSHLFGCRCSPKQNWVPILSSNTCSRL